LPSLTGRGFLVQAAVEKKTELDDEVLDLAFRFGLEPDLDKRFEQMSTGTRRKVYLVAAALGNPAAVVADGPSNGLHAGARGVLAELFRAWPRGRWVLFASYDADLVQAWGARVLGVAALR